MRCMVIVKASKDSEAGKMPGKEMLEAMGKFNEELAQAGILVSGDGLKASSHGARVQFNGTERTVIDGPFAETKELIAGYWVWNVKSLEEAIEWAKKSPNPQDGESEMEIRPFFELDDFAEATPEFKERQQEIRANPSRARN